MTKKRQNQAWAKRKLVLTLVIAQVWKEGQRNVLSVLQSSFVMSSKILNFSGASEIKKIG